MSYCIKIAILYKNALLIANAAFTLNGFDDQARNLTSVKTDFQVLNSNFMPAILSRLSNLFINYISRDFDNKKYFYTSFSFGI